MRVPGQKTVRRGVRWLRSRFRHRALILGYHRIAEDSWDPFSLCVSPGNFSDHLEVIRELASPLGLSGLANGLCDGRLPPRGLVVTFDDGYADNLYCAKPLLERHEIPATVFVVAGHLGREFWWDELARSLAPSRVLPAKLSLTVGGKQLERQLDLSGGPERLKSLLLELQTLLQPLTVTDRESVVQQVRASLAGPSAEGPVHRCLRADELAQLVDGELIDVGAHSLTHTELARLPRAEMQSEIVKSKAELEGLLGRRLIGFSYPYGSSSAETGGLIRDCGFQLGCGSTADVVLGGSDLFQLPRFWVPDVDGPTFGRWLRRWLGA